MRFSKTADNKDMSVPENTRKRIQSNDDKFIPTCKICGEQHWPAHPLIPCLNKKKVRAKAKAEAKARAMAEAKERAQVKTEKKARAKAGAIAKAQAKAQAKDKDRLYAQKIAEAEERIKAETRARERAEEKGFKRGKTGRLGKGCDVLRIFYTLV